jgi:hypothetical protein
MSEKKQRKAYSGEFKAKVGLEALRGVKTINLKTVVTPFRQHCFGEIRPLEAGQSRSMCV